MDLPKKKFLGILLGTWVSMLLGKPRHAWLGWSRSASQEHWRLHHFFFCPIQLPMRVFLSFKWARLFVNHDYFNWHSWSINAFASLRSADFRRILRPNTFKNRKSALHSGILFENIKLMNKPRSDSPLHFGIGNLHHICTEKYNASAQRFLPQPWLSSGRRLAGSRSRLNHFLSFFLGFRRPNLITGLSWWRAPD